MLRSAVLIQCQMATDGRTDIEKEVIAVFMNTPPQSYRISHAV